MRQLPETRAEGLTSGIVVGKAVIDGATCDHLAFSRPGVDFQVWVTEGRKPFPCKYVVTDTATPARLSVTTLMRDWSTKHSLGHADFTFSPPKGDKAITFKRLDAASAAGH